MDSLMTAVATVLTDVAADTIVPMFRRVEADAHEVTPGEWVTKADLAAEAALLPRLTALLPEAGCVAEEACKVDPRLMDELHREGLMWLIDPLDGTSNYARGSQPFRSMVALVRDGQTVASWIHDPLSGSMAMAELGSGAWHDGARVRSTPNVPSPGDVHGSILRRFLPPDVRRRVDANVTGLGEEISGSNCAGDDYVAAANGSLDYVLYWRTLAWDHIPGALFLTEAGGVVRRPDGSDYQARTHSLTGLLAAPNDGTWDLVRSTLLP
ncbi:MAG: inositol monophosphatase family protein [Dermatophilus congolensis]|nr:inositol monophosphatase family protein [Dermatophilus congolensis]